MVKREVNLLKSHSFFLFGARGTGKSTLLEQIIPKKDSFWVDLLLPEEEAFYAESPGALSQRISELKYTPDWIVIDEIQKVPKLLDVVHYEIEKRKLKFALTGSSARKLKRKGVNLLAGRAFVNYLYPLTHVEIANDFDLIPALSWGTLPFVTNLTADRTGDEVRKAFLQSYVETYLKEEILQEQIIRNIVPFRKFLSIASQLSGTMLNYSSIASDLKVDWATVRSYFEILEDTLLGFNLPAYNKSLRKQQLQSSKFYIFDLGIKRALDKTLGLKPSTGQIIGPLFEHFVISEIYRLNHYYKKDFELSYLATQGGLEVDLILERPGEKTALIEIKSSENVSDKHLRHIEQLASEYSDFEAFCLCRESQPRKVGKVRVLPWKLGIKELGLVT
jgi:predicted AAA+ superfamily ATPase